MKVLHKWLFFIVIKDKTIFYQPIKYNKFLKSTISHTSPATHQRAFLMLKCRTKTCVLLERGVGATKSSLSFLFSLATHL